MPVIPFIKTPLPKPGRSRKKIEERLRRHLIKLRSAKTPQAPTTNHVYGDRIVEQHLNWPDEERIGRRARVLSECAATQSPLSRLKADDQRRIEALSGGLNVTAPPSEHRADEIAADLHAEFPWMGAATEILWHGLRQAAVSGEVGLRLPPILLNGPPGIGKSAWARHLAEAVGTTSMVFEASNENASFGLVGSQRGWGNAVPGRLLNHMMDNRNAGPVVIVDELEKSGHVMSNKGQRFSLSAALLPLLEPLSAGSWSCPYFEMQFDMSHAIWIMTVNDAGLLPEPLLSRCPPINVRRPLMPELIDFGRREGHRLKLSAASIDAICTVLQQSDPGDQRVDLRLILRMLQRAKVLETRPLNH